mgnify:CR=1 FL=1
MQAILSASTLRILSIASASIIAKEIRDEILKKVTRIIDARLLRYQKSLTKPDIRKSQEWRAPTSSEESDSEIQNTKTTILDRNDKTILLDKTIVENDDFVSTPDFNFNACSRISCRNAPCKHRP